MVDKLDIAELVRKARVKHIGDLKKEPPIPCKLVTYNSIDYGYDYSCEYEPDFFCDDCIVNGGPMDPRTNKRWRKPRVLKP